MTQPGSPVLVRSDQGMMQIIMNRPEKKNALTQEMYALMTEALKEAASDGTIRLVVFQGSGGDFSSGNDLMDFVNQPINAESPVFRFIESLVSFPKVLAAQVEGVAVGIGTTMLLHCDLVYASENAFFQLPFTKLGLCPEAASSILLPRVIGLTRAATFLLSGEAINAKTAENWGLVSNVLPAKNFGKEAEKQLMNIAAMPPDALRRARALLRKPLEKEMREALLREAQHFEELLKGPEAAEALQAFLQKRPPDFSAFTWPEDRP